METERELSVRTLSELLRLFMRQAAVEGAGHRPAARQSSAIELGSYLRRAKGAKAS